MYHFIKIWFMASVILWPLFAYTYHRGQIDGVARYKHSKQFYITLGSMYHYGTKDGCENISNVCYDGPWSVAIPEEK